MPTADDLGGRQVTEAVFSGVETSYLFGHRETALLHFHQAVWRALGLAPEDLFVNTH